MCADPANMPFSEPEDEGFENKIANIIGEELGVPVEYTWFPQAMGFTRNTLLAKRCDLIIGTGQGDELVLNTNPLYRSAYALVYTPGKGLDGVDSIFDPRLKGKRIGVVAGTPPANLVAKAGLMGKAKPYRLMVDRRYDSPAEDMIKDIRSGEIDAGVLWGPIAGYFAGKGGEKLDRRAARQGRQEAAAAWSSASPWACARATTCGSASSTTSSASVRPTSTACCSDYGVPLLDEQNQPITKPRG